jgi:hypothetical protein
MQIRVAITEKSVFKNICAMKHDNVTKMVSTPMLSWSRMQLKPFRIMSDVYIWSVCKLVAAIMEKNVFINSFVNIPDNVTKMMSRPMFSWSRIKIMSFKNKSHEYLVF